MAVLPRFKTLDDALAAGWTLAKRGVHQDVSGFNSFGYQYKDGNGRRTVGVWFSEDLNQMRQPGCIRPMFPPEE